jgi:hypothetical protein
LNEAAAFPGLSVFEGEQLSTEGEGRMGVRVGNTTLALSGTSGATLHRIESGLHVDMTSGTLFFSSPEHGSVEVHAEGALLRPEKSEPTQMELTILRPKVMQISARHGNLVFTYRQEYQVLLDGDTYRIYLDASPEPQNAAGAGGEAASHAGKTAFFIVAGAAATGVAAWGIHEAVTSGNGIESPAKP